MDLKTIEARLNETHRAIKSCDCLSADGLPYEECVEDGECWPCDVAALQARVRALEAGLRELADERYWTEDNWQWCGVQDPREIARAALAGGESNP